MVGPSGVAAIPTTAIGPPHNAVSPAVPALSGLGLRLRGKGVACATAAPVGNRPNT